MSTSFPSNQTVSQTPPKSSRMLNALVVDDTSLFRHIMADVLGSLAQVTVVGKANNGTDCLEQLAGLPEVDVVFLDVEMPVMNGLETLRVIRQRYPKLLVVMVSGHNKTNVDITIEALSLGAYDFIGKPEGTSGSESQERLRKQLFVLTRSIIWQRSQEKMRARHQALGKPKIARVAVVSEDSPLSSALDNASPLPQTIANPSKAFNVAVVLPKQVTPTAIILNSQPTHSKPMGVMKPQQQQPCENQLPPNRLKHLPVIPKVLLIGVSTGGPSALMQLIPKLPYNIGMPVLVVQHMPPKFTQSLANSLNTNTGLTVKEACHSEVLKPNVVYIAPGGFHMEVETGANGEPMLNINQKPPVNSCRPSVDVLFKSIPAVFKSNTTLSIIMTGMGRDGCEGVRYLKQLGGTYCLTQSEDSCVVYGMPKAVDDLNLNDESIPLSLLPQRICELLGKPTPSF
jgi:two-component system, chemotaxis family, protein-glutamate methylesterase/glutaminase